jgi:hypothetical protein
MKELQLIKVEHQVKVGDVCGAIMPNVTEDCLFMNGSTPIGFYIRDIGKYSEQALKLAHVANTEFLSDRVPKTVLARATAVRARQLGGDNKGVSQMSCILGSVPPKALVGRNYPTISSVHSKPSARNFVKAMLLLANESEHIIKTIAPNIWETQREIIQKTVNKRWRFGNLWTSSISNFNISAPFHRDTGNIEGCVNVIICKRKNSIGGNTTVPDYNATVDSCDNSMLVYPAWRNVHGVTPIEPTHEGGYRNTLIFYPLKAFINIE